MFTNLYGTPDVSRTRNQPLGGVYYIHLTTGANDILDGIYDTTSLKKIQEIF